MAAMSFNFFIVTLCKQIKNFIFCEDQRQQSLWSPSNESKLSILAWTKYANAKQQKAC